MSRTATRTVKSSTATKKESTMKKSTTKVETNEQRVARLQRAATGNMTIATKAINAYRKGIEGEVSGPRIMSLQHGAEIAMRNANEAHKAAGLKVPFTRIPTYLRAVEREALAAIKHGNPEPKAEPTKAATKRANVPARRLAKEAEERMGIRKPRKVAENTTAATEPAKAVVKKAAPQPRSRKVTLHKVELLNRANGSVDGHAAGCADIAKVAKAERIDRSGAMQVSSKHAAWLDYNADFLAESEDHDGCAEGVECEHGWSINWLPCAKAVPEFDSVATKPAHKVASKPAAQAGSGTLLDRNPKAVALMEYLTAAGWPATNSEQDGLCVVTAERDGERLTAYFIDNKQAPLPNPMPTFTRTDGSVVRLRNISAVRQQADTTATKRPVKAQRTVIARKRAADVTEVEEAATDRSRALPVDEVTADLDNLNEHLSGRTIAWRRTVDRVRETAIVLKVTRYYPHKDGGMLVEFLEGVPSKHGLRAGTTRTVAMSKIRYA